MNIRRDRLPGHEAFDRVLTIQRGLGSVEGFSGTVQKFNYTFAGSLYLDDIIASQYDGKEIIIKVRQDFGDNANEVLTIVLSCIDFTSDTARTDGTCWIGGDIIASGPTEEEQNRDIEYAAFWGQCNYRTGEGNLIVSQYSASMGKSIVLTEVKSLPQAVDELRAGADVVYLEVSSHEPDDERHFIILTQPDETSEIEQRLGWQRRKLDQEGYPVFLPMPAINDQVKDLLHRCFQEAGSRIVYRDAQ